MSLKDKFKFRKTEHGFRIGDWYNGWKSGTFNISVDECGYEEPNMKLNIALLGWFNHFTLPFKSRKFPYGDCDSPSWGVKIHNNTLWIHYGGLGNGNGGSRYKTWDIPFFSSDCVGRFVKCYKRNADGSLSEETEMVPHEVLEKELRETDGVWHPIEENGRIVKTYRTFTEKYDDTENSAFYYLEVMKYRRKWLKWTSLFEDTINRIEIVFKNEAGPDKDDWKGGTTAHSSPIHNDETIDQAFERILNKEYAKQGSIR